MKSYTSKISLIDKQETLLQDNLTDEQLVVKATTGDIKAFETLIKRYEDPLLRYAGYLVLNKTVAQDMVQETFIKTYINLNSFNPAKKFSSWIYRITHNVCFDWLRKNKPEISMPEDFETASMESPEKDFSDEEMKKLVGTCLDKLPVKYKTPLVLFFLESRSYEEISDVLHLSTSNIGVLISRGKKLLRSICQRQMN